MIMTALSALKRRKRNGEIRSDVTVESDMYFVVRRRTIIVSAAMSPTLQSATKRVERATR